MKDDAGTNGPVVAPWSDRHLGLAIWREGRHALAWLNVQLGPLLIVTLGVYWPGVLIPRAHAGTGVIEVWPGAAVTARQRMIVVGQVYASLSRIPAEDEDST